jgi:allophanate hydrolase subunit 2
MSREDVPRYGHDHALRVVLGPQEGAFTKKGIDTLLDSIYTVTNQSDRIGYRLQGPAVEHATSPDIVSDGTPNGAVQVAGDGMPIVLLADRGTTGGYTKIATVISTDLSRLAQAATGDTVRFVAVTVDEAHALLRQQEDWLRHLADGPVVRFERRRFRAAVDGVACDVESDLTEVGFAPEGPGGRARRLRTAVRVTSESSTCSFDVEIDEAG